MYKVLSSRDFDTRQVFQGHNSIARWLKSILVIMTRSRGQFLPVYIAEHSKLLYVVCLMEFLSSFLHRIHLTVSWMTECRFFASKTGNTMNERVTRFKCGAKSARSSGLGHVLHVRLHVWSPQKQSRWHSLCCAPDASKMGDINPPPPSVLPPPPTPGITVHCIWIYIFRYLKSG